MTQGTFKLKIDEKITEQRLIENCIAYKLAGYNYMVLFVFYALGMELHLDKFLYYNKLLDDVR